MLYLENNTTFSGADITAYVYRSVEDLAEKFSFDQNTVQVTDSVALSEAELNQKQDDLLSMFDPQSGTRGINKVNSKYIDIVKTASDSQSLNLAKEYERSRLQTSQGANDRLRKGLTTSPIKEFGSLYSFGYSSFREKMAIRTLGRVSAKGYTRGQRTIAGSMDFVVFQSHELMDFIRQDQHQIVLLDQLPKFNIMLMMINEYGGASIFHLFGVTISTESQQTSVEDLALVNRVSFYAEDIVTVENVGNLFDTSLAMLHPAEIASKSLMFAKAGNEQGKSFKDLLGYTQGSSDNITKLINRSRGLF